VPGFALRDRPLQIESNPNVKDARLKGRRPLPFGPALRDLRMNRPVGRFTMSKATATLSRWSWPLQVHRRNKERLRKQLPQQLREQLQKQIQGQRQKSRRDAGAAIGTRNGNGNGNGIDIGVGAGWRSLRLDMGVVCWFLRQRKLLL